MIKRAEIIVQGVVQGVGFRFYTLRQAKRMGLTGQVGNLANGDVKIVAEGEKSAILTLIKDLRIGPAMSNVTAIHVEWCNAQNEFSDFTITYFP